jgi:TonB family protein
MKLCPKCARSFADGFTYCPNDATELARYDLRADLHSRRELQFLLQHDSLAARLRRELSSAMAELKRNPRAYLANLLRGEGSPRRRRKLLQAGAATAVISYASVAMLVMLLGPLKSPISDSTVNAGPEDPKTIEGHKFVIVTAIPKAETSSKASNGFLGGSRPQPRRARGGGGGGDQTPATRGVAPTPSLTMQLKAPSLRLPTIEHPTLRITETIYADPQSFLKMKGPYGLKEGINGPPSLGEGPGTGVGPGDGPGYGKGRKGGVGGDEFVPPGGKTTGSDDGPLTMTRTLRPTIHYKEKAAYTEEARLHRVEGTVVLNVTFGADGRIQNIKTVRGLSHGLTEKAIEAALRIRFTPAVQSGKPVSVRGNLEFSFALY